MRIMANLYVPRAVDSLEHDPIPLNSSGKRFLSELSFDTKLPQASLLQKTQGHRWLIFAGSTRWRAVDIGTVQLTLRQAL